MLDDSDLEWFTLLWPSAGWISALLGIAIFIIIAFAVSANKDDCASRACAHGKGMLIQHECVCVDEAPPRSGP